MSLKVLLSYNDKTIEIDEKNTFFEELYVDYKIEKTEDYERVRLTIHPKQSVLLQGLKLVKSRTYLSHEKIFCNGFQSWSESREYAIDEQVPQLKPFFTKRFQYYGDHHRKDIARGKGKFHSWTYGFIRSANRIDFVGSLTEATAFTIVEYDVQKQEMSIRKDCKGLQLSHSFPILDLVFLQGRDQEVFKRYFELMNIKPPTAKISSGWCSWYHYFTGISEEIVLKNLNAIEEKGYPFDIIQIDDGYQSKVGDWLKSSKGFPNGVAKISAKIRQKGFKAGIWIAPFICETKSEIYQHRKGWLVKDAKGKPLRAGYNAHWSSWFYVLDFYHPEVQKYLTGVFYTFLNKWNFDFIKLDFLYAACIQPPVSKTAGQLMNDVIQFLRSLTEGKLSLACGVPLGSAFGQVDYCRIGPDLHLEWENKYLDLLNFRERTSTMASLRSTLSRWQLNGKAFQSDPDVFILRSKKNHLNPNQQFTILMINTLLGNLHFTSDDVGNYSEEQSTELETIYKWRGSQIQRVENHKNSLYKIYFNRDQINWLAICNLHGKALQLREGKADINLEPYESIILKR